MSLSRLSNVPPCPFGMFNRIDQSFEIGIQRVGSAPELPPGLAVSLARSGDRSRLLLHGETSSLRFGRHECKRRQERTTQIMHKCLAAPEQYDAAKRPVYIKNRETSQSAFLRRFQGAALTSDRTDNRSLLSGGGRRVCRPTASAAGVGSLAHSNSAVSRAARMVQRRRYPSSD